MLSNRDFCDRHGHICPHCQSTSPASIVHDEWTDNGNYLADAICKSCGQNWTLVYHLAGYFVLDSANLPELQG